MRVSSDIEMVEDFEGGRFEDSAGEGILETLDLEYVGFKGGARVCVLLLLSSAPFQPCGCQILGHLNIYLKQ